MLKTLKKTIIITNIIMLLPLVAGICFWDQLPDQMATHFGANGEPDGYSSKAFAVFVLPLILVAIYWVCVLATTLDPKRRNITPKMFGLVLWIIPVIDVFAVGMTYAYNLGHTVDAMPMVGALLGVVFIIVGNYLPKARQSYTIGIKIPWTLANEENWNRTHRMAGPLWMLGGALMIASTLLKLQTVFVMTAVVLLMVLVPVVYSGWLHAKKGL